MATHGWQYPLTRGWAEVLEGLVQSSPDSPGLAIVRSVLASPSAELLAVGTSLDDLVVARAPGDAPPFDVIVVRGRRSMKPAPVGMVVIEHHATSGAAESIERPRDEAVRLFWRFVDLKFGGLAK